MLRLLGPHADAAGRTVVGEVNLGHAGDYRVPDSGLHRPGTDRLYRPTAALVVEIVLASHESWKKLPFYAAHEVDEILIVDSPERTVAWLARAGGEYQPVQRSGLIELDSSALVEQLDWP